MAFQTVTLYTDNVIPLTTTNGEYTVIQGGEASPLTASQSYLIRGCNTLESARAMLLEYLYIKNGSKYPTLEGLPLSAVKIDSSGNEDYWEAECTFEPFDEDKLAVYNGILKDNYQLPVVREDQVHYTSGNSQHTIYYGWENRYAIRLADNRTPWDFGKAINYNEGNLGGETVPEPGCTMSIAFLAPKTWLSETIEIDDEDENGDPAGLVMYDIDQGWQHGGTKVSRLEILSQLVSTINHADWGPSPVTWHKGNAKLDSWEVQPTYFTTKRSGKDYKDWYYSVNMSFSMKIPWEKEDYAGVTHAAEGWDHIWVSDWQCYSNYEARKATYIQENADRIYPYGNWKYLGFKFWSDNMDDYVLVPPAMKPKPKGSVL